MVNDNSDSGLCFTVPQPRVNPTSGYAPLAVTVTLDQQEVSMLLPADLLES